MKYKSKFIQAAGYLIGIFVSTLPLIHAQPRINGELLIHLYAGPGNPSSEEKSISVDADGVVWGSGSAGYPITNDYDSHSKYGVGFYLDHIDGGQHNRFCFHTEIGT